MSSGRAIVGPDPTTSSADLPEEHGEVNRDARELLDPARDALGFGD